MSEISEEDISITREENSRSLKKNLAVAESLPVVRNGFMSREQAVYCLGWKDKVNPTSEPQAIIYNAMGPDVATVLLTTNADTVYGIDYQPPKIDKARHYLSQWDKIDTDAVTLPPERDDYIDKYHDEGITAATEETASRKLQETIRERRERGYWDVGEMDTWSVDRCLMIELKKIGVDPSTIHLTDVNGRLQVDFSWAFPGEEPRQRKIYYIADGTYEIIDNPEDYDMPQVDGFYEKSMQFANRWKDAKVNDLRHIQRLINPNGFMLIGRGLESEDKETEIEEYNKEVLGANFTPIIIDEDYKKMMVDKFTNDRISRYAWDLYGVRKVA